MAKALVIKGANFTANKLTTVHFSESVPCTGLSISQNTISFTTLGATVQLTATKTPVNTTDTLMWASSNEDCATVVDGLVTCVGIGSATITAMCGSQTATCEVTSEITMTLSTYWNDYQFTSTDLSANPPKNYASLYAYAGKGRIYATETPTASGLKAFALNPSSYPPAAVAYPIMMPKGTDIIEVTLAEQPSSAYAGKVYFFDSTKEQTYVQAYQAALVTQFTQGISCVNKKYTFTRTAEADSFAFQVSNADITAITPQVTIAFKSAS